MPDYFPNLECDRKTRIFDCQASTFIEQLRKSADNLEAEQERHENGIKALTEERQWVITQARNGNLTAADMEYQLRDNFAGSQSELCTMLSVICNER